MLPLARDIKPAYLVSLVVALLVAGVSLAGLLFPGTLYPTEALRKAFVSNDVVNLVIGLPVLLISIIQARRGSLTTLLFWPGALFYVVYNYIAYAVAMPQTLQFAFYLALVVLSLYALYALLTSMDAAAVRQRLAGRVPERLAGGVLAGLGSLFLLRGLSQVFSLLSGQLTLATPELAVLVADLLTIPTWIIGGALLWRRQAFGYAAGAGLLFQASMLFVALLVFFLLQPLLLSVPFPLTDFVVILVMGLVCFVPFGLFLRGIRRAIRNEPLGR